MKTSSSVVLPVLTAFSAFLSLVNAHGFVSKFTVDGTSYNGNIPGGASNPSPIRQISTIDPVKGASNPNMACGQNANNAALVASAKPGSSISFLWGDPYGTSWPHNTGMWRCVIQITIWLIVVCRPIDDIYGFLWFCYLRQVRCNHRPVVQD
jgi:hypothetical protein